MTSTARLAAQRKAGARVAMRAGTRLSIGLAVVLCLGTTTSRAADEVYAAPTVEVVRAKALEWVAGHTVPDRGLLSKIEGLWKFDDRAAAGRELLQTLIDTFALADPVTRRFVESCALGGPVLLPAEAESLRRDDAGEFYLVNLNLFYARYLAQSRLYDEALAVFTQIDPQNVVDPATCLFYRSVCEHQLLLKDEGLQTLETLLDATADVPLGYTRVATLMQHELKDLKEKTLGEVSRKMQDSERRLDLGRGGQKVQKVQDEIIASLDEIIEKLEQQGGGGGGGGGGNSGNQSSAPADDSRVKGQTAPGEVDHKKLKNQGGWGALPEKDAARAKSLINRDFPAHYRRAVEEYFKKLADRPATP